MPYCENGGVAVWYETAGAGPGFVFVHANPCDHRMWCYQVARFSTRFRTLTVDLRGYGRSGKPETRYAFGAVADDVMAAIGAGGMGRPVLAGASIGAKIAFRMALDAPDAFSALVLVGGNAFRGASYDARIDGYRGEGVAAYRLRHLAELFAPGFLDTAVGGHLAAMLTDDTPRLSGEAIARLFEAFDGVDLAGEVAELEPPVLIVNGEHDLSLAGARRTAALIPGAVHRVIPGTGHLCNLEDPAAFDAIVAEFLAANGLWPEL
jgi:3-oxoadipate enol-lactonase